MIGKEQVEVIINEQHSLLPNQEEVLNETYSNQWELYPIPKDGISLEQIKQAVAKFKLDNNTVVFLSPIPAMIFWCGKIGVKHAVFHNDTREKKELPNGKVISVTARDGWELVR